MSRELQLLAGNKCFNGLQQQYTHSSSILQCDMRFSIYLPPAAAQKKPVPVLYWLSGLTCTDENFVQKAGAQRIASELNIAIVTPDTSPRGDQVPDDQAYDLGQGAGFYVNATEAPWNQHYRMYDYILQELPAIVSTNFPVNDKAALSGHSMGGHGAMTLALRNPERFTSVSAFSPICHPVNCPWGEKAFRAYLGNDESTWKAHDTVMLIRETGEGSHNNARLPALIDQGTADNFLEEQLNTESLVKAVSDTNYPARIRYQEGYDHSYFFIASFIEDHLRFHYEHLK